VPNSQNRFGFKLETSGSIPHRGNLGIYNLRTDHLASADASYHPIVKRRAAKRIQIQKPQMRPMIAEYDPKRKGVKNDLSDVVMVK
ncbi:jg14205, partial [Pararge aegeria aegeria]